MADPQRVSRFAPSPSGYLHRGHAFSALTAAATAGPDGRFLLRIEDIDQARVRPEFEAAIYQDLAWLGLKWETPARRQSQHLDDYARALEQLRDQSLVYRCFRTRREVLEDIGRAPHGAVPAFTGQALPELEEARRLEAGEAYAWRLSIAAARARLGEAAWASLTLTELEFEAPDGSVRRLARPDMAGDVILARKDLGVAYHLAVVVDDALQGVTHVVRGCDLIEAVDVQRLLQALLGVATPVYRHHRLLLRPDGKRFAKRDTTETLRDLRGRGVTAQALRAELGF